MKPDTVAMILLAVAMVGGAICISLGGSLAQWAVDDVWPSKINWVVIVVSALGAGFQAVISFMSSSYARWKDSRDKEPGK